MAIEQKVNLDKWVPKTNLGRKVKSGEITHIDQILDNGHKILESDEKVRSFRLLLTKSAGQVIKNGLYLLGINTVSRM